MMPSTQATSSSLDERERLESSLSFWQKMMSQLDRDEQRLGQVLRLACGILTLCLVGYPPARSWSYTLGATALVGGVLGMGKYMISVRRTEYAYQIADVQQQLHTLISAQSSGVSPKL